MYRANLGNVLLSPVPCPWNSNICKWLLLYSSLLSDLQKANVHLTLHTRENPTTACTTLSKNSMHYHSLFSVLQVQVHITRHLANLDHKQNRQHNLPPRSQAYCNVLPRNFLSTKDPSALFPAKMRPINSKSIDYHTSKNNLVEKFWNILQLPNKILAAKNLQMRKGLQWY